VEVVRAHAAAPGSTPQIVMRDRVTGKPRGFGFITFAAEAAAAAACQDVHVIDARAVRRRSGGGGGDPRLTGGFGSGV
jgi:RNA-binding protein Musashi